MKYTVCITAPAHNDILQSAVYISNNLCNPNAADKLLSQIAEKLNSLADAPHRYAVVNDDFLAGLEIRMIKINNYDAFYRINDAKHTVTVLRVLYEKRDWQHILI